MKEKFKILNFSMVTMKLIKVLKIVNIVVRELMYLERLKKLILILFHFQIKI